MSQKEVKTILNELEIPTRVIGKTTDTVKVFSILPWTVYVVEFELLVGKGLKLKRRVPYSQYVSFTVGDEITIPFCPSESGWYVEGEAALATGNALAAAG